MAVPVAAACLIAYLLSVHDGIYPAQCHELPDVDDFIAGNGTLDAVRNDEPMVTT